MNVDGSVAAVVLAGGASRRMGRDKALLTLPDGRTALQAVLDAAHAVAHPVLLAVDTEEHGARLCSTLPAPRPLLLLDSIPGAGPLAVLAAAMREVQRPALLALAVDTPLVRPALLGGIHVALYSAPSGPADVAIPVLNGHPQPLLACYRTQLASRIEQLLQRGHAAPRALLEEPDIAVLRLDEAMLRSFDPHLCSFLGANTPSDWERLRAFAAREACHGA